MILQLKKEYLSNTNYINILPEKHNPIFMCGFMVIYFIGL